MSLKAWMKAEGFKNFDDVANYYDLMDSVIPATCEEGCEVEPDGTCPHGCPSVLLAFGLM